MDAYDARDRVCSDYPDAHWSPKYGAIYAYEGTDHGVMLSGPDEWWKHEPSAWLAAARLLDLEESLELPLDI